MRQRKSVRGTSNDLQTLKQRAFAGRGRRATMIETLESRRLLSAGDLDTTFSGDGKVTTDLGTGEQANKVLVQSDGKVVVAGTGNGDARLVRYNANGTLDTTFDGDGIARLSWNGTETFTDAVLLPDGKILAGGNHNGGWWIARYKSNGTLDANSGFGGTDGIQTGSGSIAELALQGSNIITADRDGNIRRHTSTGALDTTFGSGGTVNIGAATGMDNFRLIELVVAPGGKIVAAGWADVPHPTQERNIQAYAVARLNSNGSADTTFAGDGSKVTPLDEIQSGADSVIAQPDGKLITIGREEDGDATLIRLNVNGTFDATFGTDGRHGTGSTTDLGYRVGTVPIGLDLALQSDGKIVVGGTQELAVGSDQTDDFFVQRFTSTGVVDNTFSGDGLTSASFGAFTSDVGHTVAIAPDGRIVLAGQTGPQNQFATHIAVARFEGGDNAPDSIFIDSTGVVHGVGTAGNDTLAVDWDEGGAKIKVTVNAESESFNAADVIGVDLQGLGGDDDFDSFQSDSDVPVTYDGGEGNDELTSRGFSTADTFLGGNGNDTVLATGGHDDMPAAFDGGAGIDTIHVVSGPLDLRLFPTIEGGILEFGTLHGNTLNNVLQLWTGGGTVFGLGGDDRISQINGGGPALATLDGGDGNDVIVADTEAGATVIGGAGHDHLSAQSSSIAPRGTLFQGDAGNDTIIGDYGKDTVYGGDGDDSVLPSLGNDSVFGEGGNDTIQDDDVDDRDNPSTSDHFEGGPGNDTLIAGLGNNALFGNDGDDTFESRNGNTDQLDGGDGFDRARRDPSDPAVNIEEFIDEGGPTSPVYIQDRVVHVDGTDGNDTVQTVDRIEDGLFLDVTLNGVTYTFSEDDFDSVLVRGFAGNDSLTELSTFATLVEGGEGNDSVVTNNDSGFATVVGGAGDDVVEFDRASRFDSLAPFDGGAGRDKIIVDGIADLDLRVYSTVEDAVIEQGTLQGNSLNNALTIRHGGVVRGHDGDDTIQGSGDNDALFGGNGNDRIYGGGGDDYIEGNFGNDTMYGNAGADQILGHQGNDYFWVREGERDTLDGGAGNYDRAQVDSIDVATNMEAFIP